jgi:hypothetical protein
MVLLVLQVKEDPKGILEQLAILAILVLQDILDIQVVPVNAAKEDRRAIEVLTGQMVPMVPMVPMEIAETRGTEEIAVLTVQWEQFLQ